VSQTAPRHIALLHTPNSLIYSILDIRSRLCYNVKHTLHQGVPMLLQNRLKEVRLKKGYTQEDLGEAVDVTRQSIIAIEKGRFRPSVELALKLALESDIEEIFWLEEVGGE
jgi:putative transcriptional regulator